MSAHDTPEVGSGETEVDFDSLADWLGNMDEATTVITIDVESLAVRIVARLERILAAHEAAWAEKYAAVVGERDRWQEMHRVAFDAGIFQQDRAESAEAALATALREKAEDRARVEAVEALADEWAEEGPSLVRNAYDGSNVTEGLTLGRCAEHLRAALAIPTATGDE